MWNALLRDTHPLTLFMAVPTVYFNLIKYYHEHLIHEHFQKEIKGKLKRLRLMVSGSASLPEKVMH